VNRERETVSRKRFHRSEAPLGEHPPSIDALLSSPRALSLSADYGRDAVKTALREAIAEGASERGAILANADANLAGRFARSLRRAINGTGVLLHTNLGRAPLGAAAREALAEVTGGYATVEHDPDTGARGRRQDHVRPLARALFGAADALAVNNNAAGVFLALSALARGRGVLISRGELVAIGGSFKIPEILEASGARLVEVGTTNRTTIADYDGALTGEVALILTVHPSNYEIRGYTRRPEPRELARLAAGARIPWVHDQGTGCVVPLDEFGVAGEATVRDCLSWGADVVTFSADKLMGGPQAGLVVGAAEPLGVLARHPIARTLRPDKLTLAALAATLREWQTGRWRDFPIYRAAAEGLPSLEERGGRIRSDIGNRGSGFEGSAALEIEVIASEALFGGGTSPEKRFPSRALALRHPGLPPDELARALRTQEPPVLGRIEADRLLLDLRTVAPDEDALVTRALRALATGPVP